MMLLSRCTTICGLVFGLSAAAMPALAAPSVGEILKGADLARSGSEKGMTWEVEVDSEEQGVKTETRYKVMTQGDNALAEALSPARSKGELLLYNGRILWFFRPGISRPVSLPLRQRLSGQTANGDIAHTNYVRDYDGKLTGEEKVGSEPAYALLLTAKEPEVAYEKIRYWVSKAKLQGLKAQFMTADGTVLKEATFTYGNKLDIGGKQVDFVKEIHFVDAANAKNQSTMVFRQPHVESHDESLFNVNNTHR